jgi:hypothetical protein
MLRYTGRSALNASSCLVHHQSMIPSCPQSAVRDRPNRGGPGRRVAVEGQRDLPADLRLPVVRVLTDLDVSGSGDAVRPWRAHWEPPSCRRKDRSNRWSDRIAGRLLTRGALMGGGRRAGRALSLRLLARHACAAAICSGASVHWEPFCAAGHAKFRRSHARSVLPDMPSSAQLVRVSRVAPCVSRRARARGPLASSADVRFFRAFGARLGCRGSIRGRGSSRRRGPRSGFRSARPAGVRPLA